VAVTVTPRDLIQAAYATSSKNQPGVIADEATELLGVVNRSLKAFYHISIQFDPTYFGTSASVADVSSTWTEPEDVGSIFYLEQDSNQKEVVVVLIEEQNAEPDSPAVYSLGRVLIAAAGGGQVPVGNITMYYTKEAADAADLDSTLDALWDEAHNELMVQEIALYLSIKDGRTEEFSGLVSRRNAELARFVAKLEVHYQTIRTQFPLRREINSQSFVGPTDLLAGPAIPQRGGRVVG